METFFCFFLNSDFAEEFFHKCALICINNFSLITEKTVYFSSLVLMRSITLNDWQMLSQSCICRIKPLSYDDAF